MRVIVIGLGVQGNKRKAVAGSEFIASVDPVNPAADYNDLADMPDDQYDAALVCVPDEPKIELLTALIERGKHVLVEKPLWAAEDEAIHRLDALARDRGVVCYTAYNHRFEPHFVRMRDLIQSGELGEIYWCRMFYGNGTARLVRNSDWRDSGAGVIPDLGSHLLDTVSFWFGDVGWEFDVTAVSCFENRSPDHFVVTSRTGRPKLQFEATLLMWRNHFTCDVLAEKGSAHISSLCKWGPSIFTKRTRILPSGRPPEESVTLVQDDPTWEAEYRHFKQLCATGVQTDLGQDVWLNRALREMGENALEAVGVR